MPGRSKSGPDGRKLHFTGPAGFDFIRESGESEEKSSHQPPVAKVAFADILDEARNGTQSTTQTSNTRHRSATVNSGHSESQFTIQTIVHNWVPESHPEEGTEAWRAREAGIQRVRDGYLRTTVHICGKQHFILVCQWAWSDPLNRKGTWSLEVHDFRRTLWMDDVGVEEHKNCKMISNQELPGKLARSMIDQWTEEWSKHVARESDYHKRQRLKEQMSPSIMSIERRLRPLAAFVMGNITREGHAGDKGNNGKKDGEVIGSEKNREPQKTSTERIEAARKQADLAVLAGKMKAAAKRKVDDEEAIKKDQALLQQAQRIANGAGSSHQSVNKRHTPKSSSRSSGALDSEPKSITPKRKARLEMTDEEESQFNSIRAAARRERERQEQNEREEEEEGQLVATAQDNDQEDVFSAAMEAALANASPDPETPKPSKSPVYCPDEGNKRETNPRAPPATPNASDSDSMKPPKPSKPIESKSKTKSKSKLALQKPIVASTEHVEAKNTAKELKENDKPCEKSSASGKSKTPETKTTKKNTTKSSKAKISKAFKSEEFITASDLEDNTNDDIKLASDKLQNEELSIKTTATTTATIRNEHGGTSMNGVVETNIVAIDIQQRDGSIERTEVTETTTAKTDSSEQGDTTVEHTTHVETVTQLDGSHQELPYDPQRTMREYELQDSSNAATNIPEIDTSVSPPPAPASVTSPKKRKSSLLHEEIQPATQAEQHNAPSSPHSPKRRKTTPPASPPIERGAASNPGNPPNENNTTAASTDLSTSPPKHDAPFARSATSSPLISPSASVVSSTSSSSSKKRKVAWSEQDGEVTISPAGTKRVKRVQSSSAKVSNESTQVRRPTGHSEQAVAAIVVGLFDVEKVGVEEDQGSFDSLFDEA